MWVDGQGEAIVAALKNPRSFLPEIPPYPDELADGEAPAPKRELPIEWAGEVEPVIDGFWLVDDWLPQSGIAAVYGHPGSGKSFFMMSIAAHIASGREWNGNHVEQGLVVYVVAEGQMGFRNRLHAMQREGEIDADAPFAFIPCPIDMQDPEGDVTALITAIEQAQEHCGQKAAAVVLDTLSKTFGAGKENTDDMVAYVNNCQRVASEFDCLTCVVHHRPKDSESRDLRGHSSLRGNIDTAILIEAGDIKTATTLKQKDGEDNLTVRFKLNRTVIGTDKRGKEVSTCLVEFTEERPVDDLYLGLKGNDRGALEALVECENRKQVDPATGEITDRLALVDMDSWRTAMLSHGLISRDNADTAERQFRRLRSRLFEKGKIEIEGVLVRTKRPDTGQ